MLLACILLMNTAGYAVAADNTASVAGYTVEEQCSEHNQCELMNESETGSVDTGKQSTPSDPGENCDESCTPDADETTVTESGGLLKVNGSSSSPGSVAVNPENSTGTVRAAGDSAGITSVTIREAAADLVRYIETCGKLPATVSVGGQKLSTARFLDLMLKDLLKLGGSRVSLTLRTVGNAPKPSGSATGQLSKSAYLKVASSVLKFIDSNRRAPNYVSSAIGKISCDNLVYAVARILKFQSDNNRLPNYVTIKKISASTAPTASLRNRAENDPFTGESTSRYLAATANCQVDDPSIKSLAANLTAGLTCAWDKATAIFNWVRDRISYSFYYNTRYGATGTLKYRTGNCVDHSHLLVALFRAAGFAARYVHGTCTFTSGNTYGHVWAQVLVGDTWYAADATSSKNSLGAVNSWNTATAKIKGIYASLPF